MEYHMEQTGDGRSWYGEIYYLTTFMDAAKMCVLAIYQLLLFAIYLFVCYTQLHTMEASAIKRIMVLSYYFFL